MRNYQFPMEATMYATRAPKRDREGNVDQADVRSRKAMGNILLAQMGGNVANSILDQYEPQQKKKPEEKDFGDRFREVTRNVVNVAVPLFSAAQMIGSLRNPSASAAEKVDATANTVQAVAGLLEGGGGVNTQKQDLGGPQPAGPADNAYTQASEQELQQRGAEDYVQKSLFQQEMGQSPTPQTGNQDSLINRQRQAIEDTMSARRERMPGIMRDLNKQVDDDMAQRLAGLEREAAQYPKTTEIDYQAQGIQAGKDYLAQQQPKEAPKTQIQTVASTSTVSKNPLLRRKPASSFAEEYGLSSTEKIDRDVRKAEDAESLAKFYANIPADPETGERNIDSFLVKYNEDRGAVEPRNSGELLSDQLEGQTAFNQQESREPFIQEQAAEAINALDEQGPGFTSGSIADMFTQASRELAQSDARLYRNVGESLGKMKQILSEFSTEGKTAIPTQSQKQLSATKAEAQKDDYLMQALGRLGEAQAETQRQLSEMRNPTVVPTPEMVPDFVKSDFLVPDKRSTPEPSKTVPSVGERLKSAGIGMQGMPVEFDGDGIGMNVQGPGDTGYKSFDSLSDMGAKAALEKAGVSAQEATDYWTGKLKAGGLIGSEPVVKKTTIIEEVQPSQQSTKPMDVAEKLRRIQTSGRPNARQEAQDFLASIKEQMNNG